MRGPPTWTRALGRRSRIGAAGGGLGPARDERVPSAAARPACSRRSIDRLLAAIRARFCRWKRLPRSPSEANPVPSSATLSAPSATCRVTRLSVGVQASTTTRCSASASCARCSAMRAGGRAAAAFGPSTGPDVTRCQDLLPRWRATWTPRSRSRPPPCRSIARRSSEHALRERPAAPCPTTTWRARCWTSSSSAPAPRARRVSREVGLRACWPPPRAQPERYWHFGDHLALGAGAHSKARSPTASCAR